ncbi:hypothetical protein ZWY2020_059523 [Hordeum vulgare]|nr:hypothetical protein ZWY2020_059523 [Hordeum vulgare]
MGTDPADQSRPTAAAPAPPRPRGGRVRRGRRRQPLPAQRRPEIKVRRLETSSTGTPCRRPRPRATATRTGPSATWTPTVKASRGSQASPARLPEEFASGRAVHGHMRVHHARGGGRQGIVVGGGWAVTGKRGFVGGRSASPQEEEEGAGDSTSMTSAVAAGP